MDREEYGQATLLNHWYFKGKRDLINDYIDNDKRILEIGCGVGQNILRYNQSFGLELNVIAIKHAKENGIKIIRGGAQKLPIKENTFDLILILDVLEHLEDDLTPLEEICKTLRPNGVIIIIVPALKLLWRAHDEFLGHNRRYHIKEMEILLAKVKIRIVKLNYWNFISFFPVLIKKFLMKSEKSDLKETSKWLNAFLFGLLKLEKILIYNDIPLPVGVSIFVMGKKA